MARTKTFYNRVRGGIGVRNRGFLYARRAASGQFSADTNDAPVNVAAFRWPSMERYSKVAGSGQLADLLKGLNSFVRHLELEGSHVVYNAFLPAFNKSKIYCPRTEGGSRGTPIHLVESARLEVAEQRGNSSKVTATISYGHNGNPFYAVYVHEIMKYRHEPPTRAKFLEIAIREELPAIERALVEGGRRMAGGA